MFCSTCGNSVHEKLNYCNVCGAKINNGAPRNVNSAAAPILSIAIGFFGVAGLFGFIMLLKILLESRLDQAAILTILIVYLVALFLICSVIAGHIWKPADININAPQTPDGYAPPRQFRAENTNQLPEARESFVTSVTEETTRTLDKVKSKI